MKQTFIFAATQKQASTTSLFKSLEYNDLLDNAYILSNNTKPLPEVYNQAIDLAIDYGAEYLVLCHDDIIIESGNLLDKIDILMSEYDVLGVAGNTSCKLQEPALWHLMNEGEPQLAGAVAHGNEHIKRMTCFGSYPQRAILLDGVFLVIKREVFEKVRFDETNPAGFHFYDLDYCLSCNKNKFKLGVSDILITHESPGLDSLENPQWKEGQEWFLTKWK